MNKSPSVGDLDFTPDKLRTPNEKLLLSTDEQLLDGLADEDMPDDDIHTAMSAFAQQKQQTVMGASGAYKTTAPGAKKTFSMAALNPNKIVFKKPGEPSNPKKIRVVTIREAIDKANIVRLRSGSPGHASRVKMEFTKEMAKLGLQKDVQTIGQTKNELAARSTDINPEVKAPQQSAYLPF